MCVSVSCRGILCSVLTDPFPRLRHGPGGLKMYSLSYLVLFRTASMYNLSVCEYVRSVQ